MLIAEVTEMSIN